MSLHIARRTTLRLAIVLVACVGVVRQPADAVCPPLDCLRGRSGLLCNSGSDAAEREGKGRTSDKCVGVARNRYLIHLYTYDPTELVVVYIEYTSAHCTSTFADKVRDSVFPHQCDRLINTEVYLVARRSNHIANIDTPFMYSDPLGLVPSVDWSGGGVLSAEGTDMIQGSSMAESFSLLETLKPSYSLFSLGLNAEQESRIEELTREIWQRQQRLAVSVQSIGDRARNEQMSIRDAMTIGGTTLSVYEILGSSTLPAVLGYAGTGIGYAELLFSAADTGDAIRRSDKLDIIRSGSTLTLGAGVTGVNLFSPKYIPAAIKSLATKVGVAGTYLIVIQESYQSWLSSKQTSKYQIEEWIREQEMIDFMTAKRNELLYDLYFNFESAK